MNNPESIDIKPVPEVDLAIQEQLRDIKEALNRKTTDLSDDDFDNYFFHRMPEFVDSLQSKYSRTELEKYKLFHYLIGSTPVDDLTPYIDLPGDVIRHFIENEI